MGPVQHVNAQIVAPVYFVRTNRSLVGQVGVNNAVRGRNACERKKCQQGRKIHSVMGDGSCLFRAIAFSLLKDEDQHYVIRSSIVRLTMRFSLIT